MSASAAQAALNPWARILDALEKKINRHSFDTWLKPTRFSHAEENVLFISVPSAEFGQMGDKYADVILEIVDNLGLPFQDIKFVTAPDPIPTVKHNGGFPPASATSASGAAAAPARVSQARFDFDAAAQLNPRYTFESFVKGAGTEFAHAAAQAVDVAAAAFGTVTDAVPVHPFASVNVTV